MPPIGTFLVYGPELPPRVYILTADQTESLAQGLRIARDSPRDVEMYEAQAYERTFCKGARRAVPAWSMAALHMVGTQYVGPHDVRLRYVAVRLAKGEPIEPEGSEGKGGPKGGEKVPADPKPKPRPGSPAKVRQLSGVRS